jgi:hypothetical protein
MNEYIKKLSNSDVTWDGTYRGLTPAIDREDADRISLLGDQAISDIIAKLSDKNAFAAAHVLLTQLSGVEYETFPTWNGMKVEIMADGTVNIDPETRFDLARRWEHWRQTKPRAKTLPTL